MQRADTTFDAHLLGAGCAKHGLVLSLGGRAHLNGYLQGRCRFGRLTATLEEWSSEAKQSYAPERSSGHYR